MVVETFTRLTTEYAENALNSLEIGDSYCLVTNKRPTHAG